MARSKSSSSKRKGGKVGQAGGLGGPGGRGGGRKSLRPAKGGVDGIELSAELLRMSAPNLARAVKRRAEAAASGATPYRTAMASLSSYANRHSKDMLPELRTKLASAKDELRDLFDQPHAGKGTGGPGAKRAKPKAQSRRNDRASNAGKSNRGGSHRAGGR